MTDEWPKLGDDYWFPHTEQGETWVTRSTWQNLPNEQRAKNAGIIFRTEGEAKKAMQKGISDSPDKYIDTRDIGEIFH